MRLDTVIATACAALSPRAHYARDVLRGAQRWSGADLEGKAARYGARYARQRTKARAALFKAGGCLVNDKRTGRLRSAVRLCVDDYGREVYEADGLGIVTADNLRA